MEPSRPASGQFTGDWDKGSRVRKYHEEGLPDPGFTSAQDKKQKELGLYSSTTWTADLEGVCQFMFGNVMGWKKEEISAYFSHLKSELKNTSIHASMLYSVVYAQKPLDA